MSLTIKDSGSEFTLVPVGTHLAICYMVVDLGPQIDEVYGGTKNKVRIAWEFPGLHLQRDGRTVPMSLGKTYTASLGDKASLRKLLVSWRGKEFTPAEKDKFDLKNILGKACMIQIIQTPDKQGRIRSNINTVVPVLKGAQVPPPFNPLVNYEIEHGKDAVYQSLPDFLKKLVDEGLKSCASKAAIPEPEPEPEPDEAPPASPEDDDIPF